MRNLLGFVSSPSMVRKPPSERASGSVACSFASTPTSILAPSALISLFQYPSGDEGQKALSVRTWDMVSKSISR